MSNCLLNVLPCAEARIRFDTCLIPPPPTRGPGRPPPHPEGHLGHFGHMSLVGKMIRQSNYSDLCVAERDMCSNGLPCCDMCGGLTRQGTSAGRPKGTAAQANQASSLHQGADAGLREDGQCLPDADPVICHVSLGKRAKKVPIRNLDSPTVKLNREARGAHRGHTTRSQHPKAPLYQ